MITVTIKDETPVGKALLKLGRETGLKPELLGEALVNAAAKEALEEARAAEAEDKATKGAA